MVGISGVSKGVEAHGIKKTLHQGVSDFRSAVGSNINGINIPIGLGIMKRSVICLQAHCAIVVGHACNVCDDKPSVYNQKCTDCER